MELPLFSVVAQGARIG